MHMHASRAITALILPLALTSCIRSPEKKAAAWIASAKTNIERKNYSRAIYELRSALQLQPKNAEAHYQMGVALLHNGLPVPALQQFKNAAELAPARADAHLQIARLLTDTGDRQLLALAEQHAKTALERQPNDPEILHALAVAEWRQGKTEAALQHLDQAIRIAPAHLKSAATLALIQLSTQHDAAAGERTMSTAVARSANSSEAITELGRFYLAAGLFALEEKRSDAGRRFLERALEAVPDDTDALNALANNLALERNAAAAIDRVRKQVALKPQSAPIQVLLATWLERTGDMAGASAAYRAADPAYAPALIGSARFDMLQGQWESARARVQQVLARDSRNADALLALGMLEEGTGHFDAAIQAYRRLLEIDPSHVPGKNNLVVRLSENPATVQEAVVLAQELKKAAPDAPEINDTVGWAYYKAGQTRSAITCLESAVSRTQAARPRYHLAMAYFAEGEHSRGQKMLVMAKQADADLPEAAMAEKAAETTR
jgi:tetratricopeptide (TPR) repeat protein